VRKLVEMLGRLLPHTSHHELCLKRLYQLKHKEPFKPLWAAAVVVGGAVKTRLEATERLLILASARLAVLAERRRLVAVAVVVVVVVA